MTADEHSGRVTRRPALFTLGIVIAVLAISGLALVALNDLVLYERRSPQSYCLVTHESATEREGLGTSGEWIADTGSGCYPGEPRICERGRLILDDVVRDC